MIAYVDTSSLIKLYVDEAGADAVRNLAREASIVATSSVTNVEMRASLAARSAADTIHVLVHTGGVRTRLDQSRDS